MKKHTLYVRQSLPLVLYRNHVYRFGEYLDGKHVVEVGANRGTLFEKFFSRAESYLLVESNPFFEKGYRRLARKYPNLSYEINTFEDLPIRRRFDTVLMIAVIAHIRWPAERIFEKIDAMLNPGGTLIIETNNTKRNLGVLAIAAARYSLVESKKSYTGVLRWLKIDDRDVYVYAKPAG